MFFSILTVLCVIANSWAIQVTHTPPAPAPRGTQQTVKTAAAIYLDKIQGMLPYMIAFFWTLGLAEIFTVVTTAFQTKFPELISPIPGAPNYRLAPVALIGTCLIVAGTLLRIKCY
ncbi:hypothetical protein H0H92_008989 [Tricholoma furcatifolium]|nr:hypothetical protein H0H92_008989 [Tricholoma furcatifolium]